jgi:hypothetical protein
VRLLCDVHISPKVVRALVVTRPRGAGHRGVEHEAGRNEAAVRDDVSCEVTMTPNLLDTVVLLRDVPEADLQAGDLGAIVEVLGPDAYEVEFVRVSGETQALVTLRGSDLRPVRDDDVVAVRRGDREVGGTPAGTSPLT